MCLPFMETGQQPMVGRVAITDHLHDSWLSDLEKLRDVLVKMEYVRTATES